uniref:AN1-type domain-containing protein n=1 Tax=Lotharella oceanica TaxID=641309 RepID=A0A7S2TG68_9EUKA|mmetsp:Transcript_10893/g.20831  ORF Transcript_10893/g.20831 Transcript_10893/m.20831 type:complete len:187 (+) Transcript_10893:44-604(+)
MDLNHVGKHCALKECNQLDFLPFRCGHCKRSFCLNHYKPEDHSCSEYKPPRPPVIAVCKDCKRSITQVGDESLEALFQRHFDSGECKKFKVTKPYCCSYIKKNGRPCKKREFDPIECKKCHKNFCIKHRHAEDHDCEALKKKATAPKASKVPARRTTCGTQARKKGSGTNVAHSRLVQMFSGVKAK